jgi:hypothetical protein
MTTDHADVVKMLGKRVRVRLYEQAATEGVLLGFGSDGEFEVVDAMGAVHYCWPMLDVVELTGFEEEAVEDPATWGEAERVISAALKRHEHDRSLGIIGLSRARIIADALRENGLLVPRESDDRAEMREVTKLLIKPGLTPQEEQRIRNWTDVPVRRFKAWSEALLEKLKEPG